MSRTGFAALILALAVVVGCGSSTKSAVGTGDEARSRMLSGDSGEGRCDSDRPDRESSQYDTNGDTQPDVRKVFLRVGDPPLVRLVLICREADLNGDGRKDVVRYYNDEGRPIREESDRNFDGQMDQVTYFEGGKVARQELDTSGDGRVDTKIFYEKGRPIRAERDLAGRSTATEWKPDRWEYFENGRLVRMGTDLDGDGIVDRWDRNDELKRRFEAELGDDSDEEEEGDAG